MLAGAMPVAFFLLFVGFPILEIGLLIWVGGEIGVWWTLAVVIGTAFLGTTLLHSQGFGVLQRANATLDKGQMPVEPVLEGLFLLVAGAFLLTPGLITDAIGLILLVPPFRISIARFALSSLMSRGGMRWQVWHKSEHDPRAREQDQNSSKWRSNSPGGSAPGDIIEGEFEHVDDDSNKPDTRQ